MSKSSTKLSPAKFRERLEKEVKTFNKQAAAALCDQLVQHLSQRPTPYPEKEALDILNLLRRKRMFALMQTVADALIQSGQAAFGIRRQYAQSLIDQGNMTAASAVLDALVSDTRADSSEKAKKENAEACGLKGRVYKQLYINAQDRASERSKQHLKQAVRWYFDVYTSEPEKHLWHGINVAALLLLARRAGVVMEGFPKPETIAEGILKTIKAKKTGADQWDCATAVEACVALDKPVEAKRWLGKYVKSQHENQNQYADAFELASTLRQFEEVWQLDITSEMGKRILPVLRAELLEREGGRVTLSVEDLRPENRDPLPDKKSYESMFGNAALDSYKSLKIGMARARAVARIQRKNASLSGGTGFLVEGKQLSEDYGDGLLLLTNAHVVSDDPQVRQVYGALHPTEAVITFEALGETTYKVKKLLWTSEPSKLDATILELDKPVEESDLYPLAEILPVVNPEARVYIIGHPGGGELAYSIQDNLLLDHQDPPGFIHYRTPTKPGSSGSPVFNRDWDLIGLHHAGAPRPKLNKKKGTYEANEGIWIKAIIRELAKLSGKDSPQG
jgi:V8-like Glu-specific endopeptidase